MDQHERKIGEPFRYAVEITTVVQVRRNGDVIGASGTAIEHAGYLRPEPRMLLAEELGRQNGELLHRMARDGQLLERPALLPPGSPPPRPRRLFQLGYAFTRVLRKFSSATAADRERVERLERLEAHVEDMQWAHDEFMRLGDLDLAAECAQLIAEGSDA